MTDEGYARAMAEAKARFHTAMAPFAGIRWILLPVGVAVVLYLLGLI
jgi:hypothetical protein